MVDDLISVCVTTRHRPAWLLECLQSILRQRYRPLEIIVGDNSENDESERAVRGLALPEGVSLVYRRHRPVGDFVQNHNWAFAQARGARLALIHDDDFLCDGGLDRLAKAWDDHPGAAVVYGRIRHVKSTGEFDPAETERLNTAQRQSPAFAGPQPSKPMAALTQQLGPNGWLVDTALLRQVGGFRSPSLVGTFNDIDFGVRLALASGERPFVYVHDFTSCMRQGPTRLSSDRNVDIGAIRFRKQLRAYPLPPDCEPQRQTMLRRLTEISVVEAARTGQRRRAIRLLGSPHYKRSWLSPHTLYRLVYIASPTMAKATNRLFRGL